jgi:hypothetical protein
MEAILPHLHPSSNSLKDICAKVEESRLSTLGGKCLGGRAPLGVVSNFVERLLLALDMTGEASLLGCALGLWRITGLSEAMPGMPLPLDSGLAPLSKRSKLLLGWRTLLEIVASFGETSGGLLIRLPAPLLPSSRGHCCEEIPMWEDRKGEDGAICSLRQTNGHLGKGNDACLPDDFVIDSHCA